LRARVGAPISETGSSAIAPTAFRLEHDMRFSVSLIFGGLGLAALWLALASTSWAGGIRMIGLGVFLMAASLAMAGVVAMTLARRDTLREGPMKASAGRMVVWAGTAYVVLNLGAILSLAAAAVVSEAPVLTNDGLAASLLIWTVGQGGYLIVVAAIAPWTLNTKPMKA
jgi:hypothetical protein